ncbi:MAG TPA: phosphatase PAP2 family protein [Thermomicrobiales bacterium]|nr:phosphatase PAP2 family protein [Thermomicrobiales bacterium]
MGRFRTTASKSESYRDRHPSTFNPDRLAVTRGVSGIGIAAICLAVFTVLFVIVRRNKSQAVDAAITINVQGQKSAAFDRLMHIVSWPGFPPQSRLLPPAISALLWMLGFRLEAVFQGLAWGTGLISFSVKRAMRRPRPTGADSAIRVVSANIGGSSFPSGHVLNYIGVYGFLAYLAHTWIRPVAVRRTIVGLLVSLVSLVGPSRVYLGHHWFTDVTASYMLGTTYLLAITNIYRIVRIQVSRRLAQAR